MDKRDCILRNIKEDSTILIKRKIRLELHVFPGLTFCHVFSPPKILPDSSVGCSQNGHWEKEGKKKLK